MSSDIFSQKSNAKNILCLVGWEKLYLKILFITKVVLKNIPLIFLLKKLYAKIMCIDYKYSKLCSCGGKNFPKKKETYMVSGDRSLVGLLTSARTRMPLYIVNRVYYAWSHGSKM